VKPDYNATILRQCIRPIRGQILVLLLLACSLFFSGALFSQQFYWEDPEILVPDGASFVRAASGGGLSAVLRHEYGPETDGARELYLSLSVMVQDNQWQRRDRIIGPISYVGDSVPVASIAVDQSAVIYIALSETGDSIGIYRSTDQGRNFEKTAETGLDNNSGAVVAPRLFISSSGALMLFVTRPLVTGAGDGFTAEASLGAAYTTSSDGVNWTPFSSLVNDGNLSYVYLPNHTSHEGRDYIVFQASPRESRFFQIYLTASDNNGLSWSDPVRITSFEDRSIIDTVDPDAYDNQRPFIYSDGRQLHLAWERRFSGTSPPQIFYTRLENDGSLMGEVEMVSRSSSVCRNPILATAEGETVLIWFDDRKGDNRIFLAWEQGLGWQDDDISIMDGASSFPRAFIQDNELRLVWENSFQNRSRLVYLTPDRSATPPVLSPVNFRAGTRARQDTFTASWNLPEDSSGIAGFSYKVDRDPEGSPPREMMLLRNDPRRVSANLEEDGSWYFHVASRDYAGNWSDTVTLEAVRDTTPPSPISFQDLETDDSGYLPANTWTISWDPPPEEDTAGYAYRLQYLTGNQYSGDLEDLAVVTPVGSPRLQEPSFTFRNIDNGIWGLSVAPVDQVGNVGEARSIRFRANKYIPVTFITDLSLEQDDLGSYSVTIRGRGFSVGGEIEEIILDRDRTEPYDYQFSAKSGMYSVVTDRIIDGPIIEDIDEGTYYLGVVHPVRGTYFAPRTLSFSATGTVKFGDFTIFDSRPPLLRKMPLRALSGGLISFLLIMVLLLAALLFSLVRLYRLIREGTYLRYEAIALLENRLLPHQERKERIDTMAKERKGLRRKFALLVTFLVLIIVMLVALPLGRFMIQTQQRNLADGLQQSTKVLVESLAAGAGKFLPEENTIELGRLPVQSRAAEDALYATITGFGSSQYPETDSDHFDYLWATNDPAISEKIVSMESEDPGIIDYPRGATRIEDPVSPQIEALKNRINNRAEEEVGALSRELARLQDDAGEAATRLASRRDEDTAQLLQELQDAISNISSEIEETLMQIGSEVSSVPEFDYETILTGPSEYIFYRPIIYQDSSRPGVYYHGLIRLGITTERIQEEIITSRDQLVRQTSIIALVAVFIGIVGAMILASIIIIPIKKLVKGVEFISETEDKEQLKTHVIKIRSRDELFQLAETINDMTRGLVKAAVASKDLTLGKEIQKMFIPLQEDSKGQKTTIASDTFHGLNFFGYYEGAKGVSGDYFDYMELPGNLYATIKCDVAGKGVPASLIMVEVATIFRNFLNEWKENHERSASIARSKGFTPQKQEPPIEQLVTSINGLVQERGFQGRFAALIVVLIDGDTGKTVMCNAGDNQVHLFDGEKGAMDMLTLPQAPAAGVFPNDLVNMKGGFAKVNHNLRVGDRLFLFTDGVEEAQRKFRNENYEVITCQEPGLKQGDLHDTHPLGNDNEELGIPRIQQLLNTYYRKGIYRLETYHNAVPDEPLEFDFSQSDGSLEEAVLAMVSVEKVFRLNPDPRAQESDKIEMDERIDQFLEKYFLQFKRYFTDKQPSSRSGFVVHSKLKEDEQYDDLTILAIEKV
jgi:serine phosphatase RsbU (regulator of sigma subunit)